MPKNKYTDKETADSIRKGGIAGLSASIKENETDIEPMMDIDPFEENNIDMPNILPKSKEQEKTDEKTKKNLEEAQSIQEKTSKEANKNSEVVNAAAKEISKKQKKIEEAKSKRIERQQRSLEKQEKKLAAVRDRDGGLLDDLTSLSFIGMISPSAMGALGALSGARSKANDIRTKRIEKSIRKKKNNLPQEEKEEETDDIALRPSSDETSGSGEFSYTLIEKQDEIIAKLTSIESILGNQLDVDKNILRQDEIARDEAIEDRREAARKKRGETDLVRQSNGDEEEGGLGTLVTGGAARLAGLATTLVGLKGALAAGGGGTLLGFLSHNSTQNQLSRVFGGRRNIPQREDYDTDESHRNDLRNYYLLASVHDMVNEYARSNNPEAKSRALQTAYHYINELESRTGTEILSVIERNEVFRDAFSDREISRLEGVLSLKNVHDAIGYTPNNAQRENLRQNLNPEFNTTDRPDITPTSRESITGDVVDQNAPVGSITSRYESGSQGVAAISSGAGDPGGVSYGSYQLSSNAGTLNDYLQSEEGRDIARRYGLDRLTPGTLAFNAAYSRAAQEIPEELHQSQHDFIMRTHYRPVENLARNAGFDVNNRAVQEALFSQSVQTSYDGNRSIIRNSSSVGSVEDQIRSLEQARRNYVIQNANLPPRTLSNVLDRYDREYEDILQLQNNPARSNMIENANEGFRVAENQQTENIIVAAINAGGSSGGSRQSNNTTIINNGISEIDPSIRRSLEAINIKGIVQ